MRRLILAVAAVAAALILSGCGKSATSTAPAPPSTGSSPAAGGARNAADVTFIQTMIPDHQQAVEMARLAGSRASTPQLKTLAGQIQGTQDRGLGRMNTMMSSWGGAAAMPGGMGGTGSMTGMMSDADMTTLKGMSGRAFDRDFLTAMIAHHKGAIAAARTEQSSGRNGPAKTLATDIMRTDSAQLPMMTGLLGSAP